MFGHTKGAFTGSFTDNPGRFHTAGHGTIVLDEVGDISSRIQLKLLRILQERLYERVGESNAREMNARVVACTNTDILQKVKNGKFREDLYYELEHAVKRAFVLCNEQMILPGTYPPKFKGIGQSSRIVAHFRVREGRKALKRSWVP